MANIEEIKQSIIQQVDKLLSENLELLSKGGKFSSSKIGVEIGKIINQELNDIRSKKKLNDTFITNEKTLISQEDNSIKKKRQPSTWNIYMSRKMAEIKAENLQYGISKTSKEIIADISLLWKEEKEDFIKLLKTEQES